MYMQEIGEFIEKVSKLDWFPTQTGVPGQRRLPEPAGKCRA